MESNEKETRFLITRKNIREDSGIRIEYVYIMYLERKRQVLEVL